MKVGANLRLFGNEMLKIYLINNNVPNKKKKNMAKSLHPNPGEWDPLGPHWIGRDEMRRIGTV